MTNFQWRLWQIEARFYNLRDWWRQRVLKREEPLEYTFPDKPIDAIAMYAEMVRKQ